jgi:hypothetical protein
MVDETAVKNPYFRKELDHTKRLIYGWTDLQIAQWYSELYI